MSKYLIVLMMLVTLLTACGGAEDRKSKHLDVGREFYEQENYEKARIEFKNAIQIDPKDPEAHFLLGNTYEKLTNFKAAAGEYLAVMQLDEQNIEARGRLGRLYLIGRHIEGAQDMVDQLRSIDPENIDAMIINSGIQATNGDMTTAIEEASKAFKLQPDNRDAALLLASLYAKSDRVDAAIRVLTESMQHNPDNIALRVVTADLFVGQGELDKAISLLKENVELEPDNVNHVAKLVSVYGANKQLAEGEALLRKWTESNDNIEADLLLVDFLKQYKNAGAAEIELKSLISKNSDDHKLQFALAKLYESENANAKAIDVYKKIIKEYGKKPPGLSAKTELARLYFADKSFDTALALIEEVLQENAQNRSALLLRAGYALQNRNADDAIVDLRAVLNANAEDVEVLKILANAHLLNGNPELARENLNKVLKIAPGDIASRLSLASLQTQANLYPRAEKNYQGILRVDPKNRQAYVELLKVQYSQKKYADVKKTLDDFSKRFADDAIVDYFSGLLFQVDKDYPASIKAFKQSLSKKPTAIEPMMSLARSYIELEKPNDAISYLEQLIEKDANNVFAINLIGELLLQSDQINLSIEKFEDAITKKPDWWKPYDNIAKAHIKRNQEKEAIDIYKKALKTASNPQIVVNLAGLYMAQGKDLEAIKLFENTYDKFNNNDVINNNYAMLLATHKKDDAASLNKALRLSENFKNSKNPAYLDTYGWVNLQLGKKEEALTALQLAAKRAPDSLVIKYHLAEAYYHNEQFDQAAEYLKKALEPEKNFEGKEKAELLLSKLND